MGAIGRRNRGRYGVGGGGPAVALLLSWWERNGARRAKTVLWQFSAQADLIK
jgi:hypothetical protein